MWIRSQDKLILASRFEVIQIDEIKGKYCINNVHSNDGYDTLGEYSTKEKALKVMDMMECFITQGKRERNKSILTNKYENGVTSFPIRDAVECEIKRVREQVFEMPQDEEDFGFKAKK